MSKSFYITTTLPYVNAEPHIGFAMEIVRADSIARYRRLLGDEVFFNTGTDEHGAKLLNDALSAGKDVQKYVDSYAEKFKELAPLLNLSVDNFIRTTDEHHIKAAQEFWMRCDKNGYIYKKKYQAKYCVGCELEKTDSELVDGRCPIHLNREIELIDEENYFFKLSAFGDKLLKYYEENRDFVVPDFRFNETKSFIKQGLEDFSISRLKSKMSWGVPVPNDDDHIMYVWFDALVNYISALGWPEDKDNFKKFWENGTPVQYCGKDNNRQQAIMWQAMLMAAELPQTNKVIINGFITGEGGVKMSKSLGNVVSPVDLVKKYGTDAVRCFVLKELSSFEDSPFTVERFNETYNTNLANGLGNLVSRTMKMAESYDIKLENYIKSDIGDFEKSMNNFDLKGAMDSIWKGVMYIDGYIQKNEPFKKIKTNPEEAKKDILNVLSWLKEIGEHLAPLLPETSKKIIYLIENNKSPEKPIFPRIEL